VKVNFHEDGTSERRPVVIRSSQDYSVNSRCGAGVLRGPGLASFVGIVSTIGSLGPSDGGYGAYTMCMG